MSRQATAITVFVVLGVLVLPSQRARACGGFFCDRPPPDGSLPIAQAAENVLFVLGKDPQTGQGTVEAHIKIVYEGAADQFSWVVPVTALPTLDVGSDALFDRLEPATRPSFKPMWQMDGTCQGSGGGDSVGCGSVGGAGARSANTGSAGAVLDGPAVEVVFRGNVGPYDSAVIRSEDPMALKTWLTTNGYYVSDASAQIVDDYVAAHSYFVALRLRQGQDTSAIQPIVVRMASEEGCLPLKLTAIAATPDVRINVWVLGDARAVPLDYVEIGVNQAKLDWFKLGANYDQLLGEAANEAGGNAFAVEYAKPSATVAAAFEISSSQIDQLTRATDPSRYLAALEGLGLAPTGLVLAVLRKHLPLPASLGAQGITETQFYGNPTLYLSGAAGLEVPFDAVATTTELQTTFFTPLAALEPLFSSHRYLTRFATFISPEEMTKDPRFVTNAALPDVEPQHVVVAHMLCGDQEYDVCHAPVRLHLEDGTDVTFAVASGAPAVCDAQKTPLYDRTGVDKLPSSDIGWLRDAEGEGHKVVDNRSAITAGLAQQNASVSLSTGGCGCSVRGRARPVAAALVLLGVLVARRRRRR